MTNHPERVYALLVEANPVEDPEQAREIIDRRRDRLTLVQPRRLEMTDRREKKTSAEGTKRPRWMIPAAAAAAVVAFVVSLVTVFDGSDPEQDVAPSVTTTTAVPVTSTTATPPTTTAPTTTQAPTTTTAPTTTQPAVTVAPQTVQVSITVDADGCRYDGPEAMNVGDTVEITVTNNTDEHSILDVYRFIGEGSTADLPGLAATPEIAYDQFYLFAIAEVWLWTPPNSEGGQLHFDFNNTQPSEDPFVLEHARDYGFICWSAPGQIADITSGVAASDGFTVQG